MAGCRCSAGQMLYRGEVTGNVTMCVTEHTCNRFTKRKFTCDVITNIYMDCCMNVITYLFGNFHFLPTLALVISVNDFFIAYVTK